MLTVSDGGTVISGGAVIGQNPDSSGTVQITGSDSSLIDKGNTVIGQGGSGKLEITNGGTLSTGGTVIGGSPDSTGMVIITGPGSHATSTGDVVIGQGGSGKLEITDGGTLSTGGTVMGGNPDSTGMVIITGPGSHATSTGDVVIGQGGSGKLEITDGGKAVNGNATVGELPGSSGAVIVDGAGSQWSTSGSLVVGPAGSGVVDISNGGAIIASDPTTIGPNGILEGNGTITTPTLINNGTVAPAGPGGTPGTMTLNGNYQQGPSGVLDTEIGGPQPSQADQLKISGSAKLDGTLDITPLNNYHPSPGNSYELLSASGGLSGQFSNIADSANTTGLTRLDIYGPNGLFVTYLPPGLGVINLSTSTPLPANLNAANLSAFLLSVLDPNVEQLSAPFDIWFSLANTQRFNLEARFDDVIAGSTGFVSNVTYPAPPPTGKELTEGKGSVTGKEAPAPPPAPECRWGVWVTGYGDFVDVDDQAPAKGYNYTTGGLTVGVDYRVTNHFVVGLMGGYAHTWTDLKPGSVDVDTGWGGLYAGYFNQGVYVLGAAFGGGNSFDTSRATILGSRANGSSDSQEWSTFISAGYDFHFGHLTIGPTAAAQYSYINIDGFSEHGSMSPVAVREDSEESWRTDLGFRAWYIFQVGRVGVRPFVRAAWEHEYKESRLPISASLVDVPGTSTTVFGPSLGHDSAVVNAGVSVQWTQCISSYVSYDGQLGRDRYDSNGVSGAFRISF
jgi:outer membrane autotransporter protein